MKNYKLLIAFLSVLAGFYLGCSKNETKIEQQASVQEDVLDEKITASVKMKLEKELKGAGNIAVETNNGLVELRGNVSSPEQADQATQIATNIEGVRAVRSFLKTDIEEAQDEESGDTAITEKVKTQLASDNDVNSSNIDVLTNEGHVVLKGVVSSKTEELKAIQLARGVEEVKSVESSLTIQ